MTREQLKHLLRAAGAVTDQDRLVMISKYVAGREKDLTFTRAVVRHGLCDETTLRERLRDTVLAPEIRQLVEARISGDFGSGGA